MEPSSQDLPFVLVYGAWIWKLALLALVASVFAIVVGLRRFAAWRWVRQVLARMERRDTDNVIRGTLGGGDAATLSVAAPYADAQRAHWRADVLWVDTADGRVHVEGELVVEVGTSGEATRYRLPGMPDALRERANELPLVTTRRWSVMRLARVSAGDEVVLRGKLVHAPGTQESTFREAPLAPTLKSGCDPMVLAACKPRHVIPMMSPVRMALLAGITLFVGYQIASEVGDRWRRACWAGTHYKDVPGFVELDGGDRCVRAAALPGHQELVHSALFHRLADHPHRDERSLARLAYLAEESDDCNSLLYVLDKAGRMDDLVTYARRCNEPRWEQAALYALGRYQEAVAVQGANEAPSLEVLIAAERWRDAARSVDETARYFATQKHDDPQTAHVYEVAARQKRCLAALFEFHAGETAAAAQLQQLASADPEHVCLPMLLEVDPLQRRQRLATMDIWGERYDVARMIQAQAFLDGVDRFSLPFARESAESTLVQLDETVRSDGIKAVWLARLAPVPEDPDDRATVLRWHAVAKVLDGKPAEAMQLASELARSTVLAAAVALHTPSTETDPSYAGEQVLSTYGRLFLRAGHSITHFRFGHDPRYAEALVAAQHGDGTQLAEIVATEKWWSMGDVLAVWPHVRQGRDLLRERLVWNARYGTWSSHSPFDLASTAAMRRDLFRLLGEDARAAYWDAVYQRVARVFDRKRMMAFLMAD